MLGTMIINWKQVCEQLNSEYESESTSPYKEEKKTLMKIEKVCEQLNSEYESESTSYKEEKKTLMKIEKMFITEKVPLQS